MSVDSFHNSFNSYNDRNYAPVAYLNTGNRMAYVAGHLGDLPHPYIQACEGKKLSLPQVNIAAETEAAAILFNPLPDYENPMHPYNYRFRHDVADIRRLQLAFSPQRSTNRALLVGSGSPVAETSALGATARISDWEKFSNAVRAVSGEFKKQLPVMLAITHENPHPARRAFLDLAYFVEEQLPLITGHGTAVNFAPVSAVAIDPDPVVRQNRQSWKFAPGVSCQFYPVTLGEYLKASREGDFDTILWHRAEPRILMSSPDSTELLPEAAYVISQLTDRLAKGGHFFISVGTGNNDTEENARLKLMDALCKARGDFSVRRTDISSFSTGDEFVTEDQGFISAADITSSAISDRIAKFFPWRALHR